MCMYVCQAISSKQLNPYFQYFQKSCSKSFVSPSHQFINSIFGSWVDPKYAGFFLFLNIRIMGYFRFGQAGLQTQTGARNRRKVTVKKMKELESLDSTHDPSFFLLQNFLCEYSYNPLYVEEACVYIHSLRNQVISTIKYKCVPIFKLSQFCSASLCNTFLYAF